MLLAEAHTPKSMSAIAPTTVSKAKKRAVPPTAEAMFEITHSTVRMDASNLCCESADVALTQIVEAVRLAQRRGKSELLIANVMPWVKIDRGEITKVPETHEMVEQLLAKACARLGRPTPEIRLSLRGGEFDIRGYLGRDKPTDHVFEDDWTSDSR